MADHDELDKLEHELHKVEFNRPYDIVEIRKLREKVQELKNKNQESVRAFGKVSEDLASFCFVFRNIQQDNQTVCYNPLHSKTFHRQCFSPQIARRLELFA